jgi:hypothetical protein
VIWVANEPHDQAPRDANKLRIKEAEALTRIDKSRFERRKVSEKDIDLQGDE